MTQLHRLHKHEYHALWISDVHLGYKGCKADYLVDFLNNTDANVIYLVGDIIDLWSLRRSFYWPISHNLVLATLLSKIKNGTRVVYIPGNHDEDFRKYAGLRFGNLEIHLEYVHTTISGKRILVLHGDKYDADVKCGKWLSRLGSWGHNLLLTLDNSIHHFCRRFDFGYWSLSAYVKTRVPNARKYIAHFEEAAIRDASDLGMDGIVCGHIHQSAIKLHKNKMYLNDGDWVESCTALAEKSDGTFVLLTWPEKHLARTADTQGVQNSVY